MIDFDEAQARLRAAVAPLASETIPLAHAHGRVLAQPLNARIGAPRADVSAMDGYAVAHDAPAPGVTLTVIGESAAGRPFGGNVATGQAVRISTGAAVPSGTLRVIIQEDVARDGDIIRITANPGPGRHIRRADGDFSAGDLLLDAGTLLDPRCMVVAAAADHAELTVSRAPRVAILATGDELAAPGSAYLSPVTLAESVSFGVAAMARSFGAEVVRSLRANDNLGRLEALAGELLDGVDLAIVTGGASVGDHDLAKPMFAAMGPEEIFSKVAIKPGKPVWLSRIGTRYVLGLPGNPTSAMVTARLFLAPLLAALTGQINPAPLTWRNLPLAAPIGAISGRETFMRARWGENGLEPLERQDSGQQLVLAQADWLIRCPAHQNPLSAGAMVATLPF